MNTAVEFRNVDILFSSQSKRRAAALTQEALVLLDAGRTRAEVSAKTGVIVGVANANLSVQRGEISVLMGLSGSGKSTLLRAANGLNEVTRGRRRKKAPDVAPIGVVGRERVDRRRLISGNGKKAGRATGIDAQQGSASPDFSRDQAHGLGP